MGESEELIREMLEALRMAQLRFSDLAAVIREDGAYNNSGFMAASAERLNDAIAKAERHLDPTSAPRGAPTTGACQGRGRPVAYDEDSSLKTPAPQGDRGAKNE